MTVVTFHPLSQQNVNWDDTDIWTPSVVPNGPDIDVVISAAPLDDHYAIIAIQPLEVFGIRSLQLIGTNVLDINGTLSVAGELDVEGDSTGYSNPGGLDIEGGFLSARSMTIGGSLSGHGDVKIVGALQVDGAIVGGLNVTAGRLDVRGLIEARGGVATVTAKYLDYFSNGRLNSGEYEADGGLLDMNVGGVLTTLNTKLDLFNGGSIDFFDPVADEYESIMTTLNTIGVGGVLDFSASNMAQYQFGALQDNGLIVDYNIDLTAASLRIGPTGEFAGVGELDAPTINQGIIVARPPDVGGLLRLVVDKTVSGFGYFEVNNIDEVIGGDDLFALGRLELKSAQSQDIMFTETAGYLTLDDPAEFTGKIAILGAASDDTVPSVIVEMVGVDFKTVTGYAYQSAGSTGTLVVHTTTGDYDLNLYGNLQTSDFTLSAGQQIRQSDPPVLDIGVAPGTSVVIVHGAASKETIVGAPPVTPFAAVTVFGIRAADQLKVVVGEGPPKAGVLELANPAHYGITNFAYDAQTGQLSFEGDAAEATSAIRAITFTPSVADVPSGHSRVSDVKIEVADTTLPDSATAESSTKINSYNGATVAQALGGAANGAQAVVDTTANLTALTPQQIAELASLGVTRLVSDNANIVYSVAQSHAIVAAQMSLGAPALDVAVERFASSTVRFQFDANDLLTRRIATNGDQVDILVFQPGVVGGENYARYDVRIVAGQRQDVFYYGADGAVLATATFPAAGVTKYQLAGADEVFAFSADAHDVTLPFASGFGVASVYGFDTPNAATDVLDLSSLFPNFAAAQGAMSAVSGTLIKDAAGDQLRIVNVAPSQLTSHELGFG